MNVQNLLKALQGALRGRKTYLTGGAMVLTGLANEDYSLVLQGLGLIFLRNAVNG